jgi:aryl-alcohol dehydrogenase
MSDRTRQTTAIVANQDGNFDVQQFELDSPAPDEVLVEIKGVGLCHTDLSVRDGNLPAPLPMVLGHEGAGIVREVGERVRNVQPGDHVVLSFDYCGECDYCRTGRVSNCEKLLDLNFGGARRADDPPYDNDSGCAHGSFFGQSSFGQFALASENSVVKVSKEAPIELLGPLGCGVQTGAGAVMNSLDVKQGTNVVVFGAGTVGLSAVMAARVRGAAQIIVVDPADNRRDLAIELGATAAFDPTRSGDIVETIREFFDGKGADYTVETSGVPAVLEQAIAVLYNDGACAVVGAPPQGEEASFDINELLLGKEIVGVTEGDAVPQVFIPMLIDLYERGMFPFDKLIERFDLDDIDDAVDASESGRVLKPVLIPKAA